MEEKEYKLVCPGCGQERVLETYAGFWYAKKHNSKCHKCHNKGHTHTKETKDKISKVAKGRTYSDEYKKNMSISVKKTRTSEVIDKIMAGQERTAFKWKSYELPNGKIIRCQGFEPQTIAYLSASGSVNITDDLITSRKEVPKVNYEFLNETHRYYPDMYIKSTNTLVECKSEWVWDKCKDVGEAKISGSLDNGFNIRLIVWDNTGEFILKDKTYERFLQKNS